MMLLILVYLYHMKQVFLKQALFSQTIHESRRTLDTSWALAH